MKLLFSIFMTFFKLSPITFGGGYAMIPVIQREVVEEKRWLDEEDVTDVFALSGSIPGAIAINAATFIGYRIAGIPGAAAATIGVMIPTFSIVAVLSFFYLFFSTHPKVEAAFEGIRPAVVALIVYAAWKMRRSAIVDKTTFIVAASAFVCLLFLHLHPVLVIVLGALSGVLLIGARDRLGMRTAIDDHEKQPDYFMGADI
ncbi:chromate transporter [Domibacillus enclensis]|uniref:Chromate transporter n=1 Tax=Domibacillus enclensis TaxID=1017273 RepID=A0A1N6Z4U0_9BACI|nr:chromate transporter [Domibacillus enclensis]OXS76592.1 chromate transporter [Domibacillus enclensis]SIR21872.1 chromate transporter [Domibacillus enclensis]